MLKAVSEWHGDLIISETSGESHHPGKDTGYFSMQQ